MEHSRIRDKHPGSATLEHFPKHERGAMVKRSDLGWTRPLVLPRLPGICLSPRRRRLDDVTEAGEGGEVQLAGEVVQTVPRLLAQRALLRTREEKQTGRVSVRQQTLVYQCCCRRISPRRRFHSGEPNHTQQQR